MNAPMTPEQWQEAVIDTLTDILIDQANPGKDKRSIKSWQQNVLEVHRFSSFVLWKLDHYLIAKEAEEQGVRSE